MTPEAVPPPPEGDTDKEDNTEEPESEGDEPEVPEGMPSGVNYTNIEIGKID